MFESAETGSHEVHQLPPTNRLEVPLRRALRQLLAERAWLAEVARLRAGADPDALIREATERDDPATLQALRSYLPAYEASRGRRKRKGSADGT